MSTIRIHFRRPTRAACLPCELVPKQQGAQTCAQCGAPLTFFGGTRMRLPANGHHSAWVKTKAWIATQQRLELPEKIAKRRTSKRITPRFQGVQW